VNSADQTAALARGITGDASSNRDSVTLSVPGGRVHRYSRSD